MEELNTMTEQPTTVEDVATEAESTETAETKPAESETNGAEQPENTVTETAAPVEDFELKYNHKAFKVTQDEARRLAQLGKHYEESEKKILDDLDYVAALKGTTVKDLVKSIVESDEKNYREELEAQLGEDAEAIEDLLEIRRQKNRKNYETAKAEREAEAQRVEEEKKQTATQRIAEQFETIHELFPSIDTVDKIPDAVLQKAYESGDLLKEMLLFEKQENNKIEAAKASENKNKNQNIGSVASAEKEDSAMEQFMRGLWG